MLDVQESHGTSIISLTKKSFRSGTPDRWVRRAWAPNNSKGSNLSQRELASATNPSPPLIMPLPCSMINSISGSNIPKAY